MVNELFITNEIDPYSKTLLFLIIGLNYCPRTRQDQKQFTKHLGYTDDQYSNSMLNLIDMEFLILDEKGKLVINKEKVNSMIKE